MSRVAFARQNGADCGNPRYAWSYINHEEKFVIFGAWLHLVEDGEQRLMSEDWRVNSKGRKSNSFQPSMRHIEFILEDRYGLFTFEQEATLQEDGIPKVKSFKRELVEKQLVKRGTEYFAVDFRRAVEVYSSPMSYMDLKEGDSYDVLQTVYERNSDARKICLEHYNSKCVVCDFDFDEIFGDIAKNFIHVHHLIEVSSRKSSYQVDPIADLRPVCPNCHAMLHKKRPPYEIAELKEIINVQAKKVQ